MWNDRQGSEKMLSVTAHIHTVGEGVPKNQGKEQSWKVKFGDPLKSDQ